MRIIAGTAGGRKLKSIRNTGVRPTLDRVKESIFNMLGNSIVNSIVADLFAGFGGLGLEAVSRGADHVIFVEKDYRNIQVIKENIKICKFQDKTDIVKDDVFKFLKRTESAGLDLIFMDPPYGKEIVDGVLNDIIIRKIMSPQGIIIVEHHKDDKIEEHRELQKLKDRSYGDTVIKIFCLQEVENANKGCISR